MMGISPSWGSSIFKYLWNIFFCPPIDWQTWWGKEALPHWEAFPCYSCVGMIAVLLIHGCWSCVRQQVLLFVVVLSCFLKNNKDRQGHILSSSQGVFVGKFWNRWFHPISWNMLIWTFTHEMWCWSGVVAIVIVLSSTREMDKYTQLIPLLQSPPLCIDPYFTILYFHFCFYILSYDVLYKEYFLYSLLIGQLPSLLLTHVYTPSYDYEKCNIITCTCVQCCRYNYSSML